MHQILIAASRPTCVYDSIKYVKSMDDLYTFAEAICISENKIIGSIWFDFDNQPKRESSYIISKYAYYQMLFEQFILGSDSGD